MGQNRGSHGDGQNELSGRVETGRWESQKSGAKKRKKRPSRNRDTVRCKAEGCAKL